MWKRECKEVKETQTQSPASEDAKACPKEKGRPRFATIPATTHCKGRTLVTNDQSHLILYRLRQLFFEGIAWQGEDQRGNGVQVYRRMG